MHVCVQLASTRMLFSLSIFTDMLYLISFLPIGSNCAVLKVLHFYTTEQPELLAVYSGRKAEMSLGQDLVLV